MADKEHIDIYKDFCASRFDKIDEQLERLSSAIVGNGEAGLKTEVAKLKLIMSWVIGAISITGTILIAEFVTWLVNKL